MATARWREKNGFNGSALVLLRFLLLLDFLYHSSLQQKSRLHLIGNDRTCNSLAVLVVLP